MKIENNIYELKSLFQCLVQTQERIDEQRAMLQMIECGESSDVETELFIGLPEKRMKLDRQK